MESCCWSRGCASSFASSTPGSCLPILPNPRSWKYRIRKLYDIRMRREEAPLCGPRGDENTWIVSCACPAIPTWVSHQGQKQNYTAESDRLTVPAGHTSIQTTIRYVVTGILCDPHGYEPHCQDIILLASACRLKAGCNLSIFNTPLTLHNWNS